MTGKVRSSTDDQDGAGRDDGTRMPDLTRRRLLRSAFGVTGVIGVTALAGCTSTASPSSAVATDTEIAPTSPAVAAAEKARAVAGRDVVTAHLVPQATELDLGGRTVSTWAYGDTVPGPLLRATAGDVLRIQVDNRLPTDTSVHWHGIAIRNDMDGVPGLTQDPIASGGSFTYEFTAPDPGTYFYHPHTGVQLDRGLYGVLVVDDPAEPGRYDHEWVVVVDDWLDGTGRTPDEVLERLRTRGAPGGDGSMGGTQMGGMQMGGMSMGGMHLGGGGSAISGGDVSYPYFLINGRTPADPVTFAGRPGERVRIRLVNAGCDTAFRVAVGGHRMTVTHSDGYPVVPVVTDSLVIGMGERYDVVVTLGDGVFPLVALAEGKGGAAMAVVRTAAGSTPRATARPAELHRRTVLSSDLRPDRSVRLPERRPDSQHELVLSGTMRPYRWTINGATYPDTAPVAVTTGQRLRMRFTNMSMMFHPMHVHGHTFAVADTGLRKDTVVVRPMETVTVDLDADNPGQWPTHCHNLYHAETGMMTMLSYRA